MDFISTVSLKQINCAFCAITTVLLLVAADVYGDSGTWHKGDQSDSNLPETLPTHIVSAREGVRYLMRYGYLKGCVMPPRRKRSPFSDGQIQAGGSSAGESGALGRYCSPSQISNALKQAQETFHIEQTGQFDMKTMSKMSSRRCGNSDKGITKGQKEKSENLNDKHKSLESSSKHSAKLRKRSIKDLIEPASVDSYDFPRQAVQNSEKRSSLLLDILSKNTYGLDNWLYFRGLSERRMKYLHTYINKVKDDQVVKDRMDSSSKKSKRLTMEQLRDMVHIRAKRSNFAEGSGTGVKFTKDQVRWRLLNSQYSNFIPAPIVERILHLSFRMWGEVSPLRFMEDNRSDLRVVDIEIGFGTRRHMGCKHNFDGSGGEVAHSWAGGDIHIDDDENYRYDAKDGLNLLTVVLHEIGHVLSLNHSEDLQSIMYPIYTQYLQPGVLELRRTDRTKVQEVYGVCKGRFNTVFDIIRKEGDRWLYYTFFLRNNMYWTYENLHGRPSYGDPRPYLEQITVEPPTVEPPTESPSYKTKKIEWSGFQSTIDAVAQVVYFNMTTKWVVNDVYVFSGEHYYMYDIYQSKIKPGYPRLIQQDFGPKPGYSEGVPSNIDSVLYDWRNQNLYFIKGEWVWIYDVTAPPDTRGCEGKRRFVDLFPTEMGSTSSQALTGNVDAAYYSFEYNKVFFFRNESVWQNKLYDWSSRTQLNNLLINDGYWYDKWHDICEV